MWKCVITAKLAKKVYYHFIFIYNIVICNMNASFSFDLSMVSYIPDCKQQLRTMK